MYRILITLNPIDRQRLLWLKQEHGSMAQAVRVGIRKLYEQDGGGSERSAPVGVGPKIHGKEARKEEN